jgi:hypothetical protein
VTFNSFNFDSDKVLTVKSLDYNQHDILPDNKSKILEFNLLTVNNFIFENFEDKLESLD